MRIAPWHQPAMPWKWSKAGSRKTAYDLEAASRVCHENCGYEPDRSDCDRTLFSERVRPRPQPELVPERFSAVEGLIGRLQHRQAIGPLGQAYHVGEENVYVLNTNIHASFGRNLCQHFVAISPGGVEGKCKQSVVPRLVQRQPAV